MTKDISLIRSTARSLSRTVALLATTAVLFPASPALAQTAPDIEAPRLVSFDFTPKILDVTSGDATVQITGRWTDPSTITDGPLIVAFDSDATSQTVDTFLDRTSGTDRDATYTGTVTFPAGSAPGRWRTILFAPRDKFGNTAGFERLDDLPTAALTVRNGPTSPTTPPVTAQPPPATTPPATTPPATTPPPVTQLPVQGAPLPPPAPSIKVDRMVIDYGGAHSLTVSGQPGQTVQLFAAALPNTPPKMIREVILATDFFTWQLQPGGTTTFYAVTNGQRGQAITVQVRRTVTIGIRQSSGVYTFSGTIARPEAGVQVTVARLDARTKRVTGVASTRTDAAGKYTIRTGLPAGMAGYYALTGTTSDLLPGRSRLYGLVVPGRSAARPAPAQALTLGVSRQGSRYVLSGQLKPGRSVPVTVGRQVNGRLVGLVGGRTTASGSYRLSLALPPGTHHLQVVTAGAASRVYGVIVPQSVMSIQPPIGDPIVRQPVRQPDIGSPVVYRNCAAVIAAGKAPIRRGDPGYGRHLDRDGDGQGCAGD